MENAHHINPGRLITREELLKLLPFGYWKVWTLMQNQGFPRGIPIGRRVYWNLDEVEAWFANRPRQKLKGDQ